MFNKNKHFGSDIKPRLRRISGTETKGLMDWLEIYQSWWQIRYGNIGFMPAFVTTS